MLLNSRISPPMPATQPKRQFGIGRRRKYAVRLGRDQCESVSVGQLVFVVGVMGPGQTAGAVQQDVRRREVTKPRPGRAQPLEPAGVARRAVHKRRHQYRQNRGSAPRPRLKSPGFRSPRGRSRGRRRSCHPASWRRRGSRRASPCHHNRQRRSLGICRRRRDRSPQPIAGHGSSHSRHGHRDRNRSRSRGQPPAAAPSTANRQTSAGPATINAATATPASK